MSKTLFTARGFDRNNQVEMLKRFCNKVFADLNGFAFTEKAFSLVGFNSSRTHTIMRNDNVQVPFTAMTDATRELAIDIALRYAEMAMMKTDKTFTDPVSNETGHQSRELITLIVRHNAKAVLLEGEFTVKKEGSQAIIQCFKGSIRDRELIGTPIHVNITEVVDIFSNWLAPSITGKEQEVKDKPHNSGAIREMEW